MTAVAGETPEARAARQSGNWRGTCLIFPGRRLRVRPSWPRFRSASCGRATWGLGKRIGGKSAELVAREVQQRTADQLFKTLGELKGGAMKLGQALSVFESALPEEIAAPIGPR